jgi:hypothetical protein
METRHKTLFTKDLDNKKIVVEREFSAPVESVGKHGPIAVCWISGGRQNHGVQKQNLWISETGGYWLYAMKGPNNEVHWARMDYKSIEKNKSFQAMDSFCDENGNRNDDMPNMNWKQSVFQNRRRHQSSG